MPTIVGIKQFHKNMSRIAQRIKRGVRVLVMKHSTPMFVLGPYEGEAYRAHTPKYGLADLQKLKAKGGDRNISKKIDKIVYGV